jgi:hypothetical protein
MKTWLVLLGVVAAVALLATVVFAVLYVTKGTGETSAASDGCEHELFGHVAALTPSGDHYELTFDPAWFTSGETANRAAAEDGVVQPGEPVPNDNYVIEEGHRLLDYIVPADASITVLTRGGDPARLGATEVSVSELAQLLEGEKPVDLSESLDTGFWMRYHVDTVCSLDQQYRP